MISQCIHRARVPVSIQEKYFPYTLFFPPSVVKVKSLNKMRFHWMTRVFFWVELLIWLVHYGPLNHIVASVTSSYFFTTEEKLSKLIRNLFPFFFYYGGLKLTHRNPFNIITYFLGVLFCRSRSFFISLLIGRKIYFPFPSSFTLELRLCSSCEAAASVSSCHGWGKMYSFLAL